MKRVRLLIAMGAATILVSMGSAQPVRPQLSAHDASCARAQEEVTRHRLGRGTGVSPARAEAFGRAANQGCRSHGGFLLAYSLARIDLSRAKHVGVDEATRLYNSGMADLDLVKRLVRVGKSDRYEIFNVLGLIYYETGEFQKSIAVLEESAPFISRMSLTSRRNAFFTRGLAQAKLGNHNAAATSFAYAKKFGHPEAGRWEAAMRNKK